MALNLRADIVLRCRAKIVGAASRPVWTMHSQVSEAIFSISCTFWIPVESSKEEKGRIFCLREARAAERKRNESVVGLASFAVRLLLLVAWWLTKTLVCIVICLANKKKQVRFTLASASQIGWGNETHLRSQSGSHWPLAPYWYRLFRFDRVPSLSCPIDYEKDVGTVLAGRKAQRAQNAPGRRTLSTASTRFILRAAVDYDPGIHNGYSLMLLVSGVTFR